MAILRTNRNLSQEASALLYRDLLLVSITWDFEPSLDIDIGMLERLAYSYAPPGTPLPPYVVSIQQRFHDKDRSTAVFTTIVAAVDFPAICRYMLKSNIIERLNGREKRTSYLILLPKMGYNVDRLWELIWSPLIALRQGRFRHTMEKIHRNLRAIDCTGVFEQTATMLDWDEKCVDDDYTDQQDEDDVDDGVDHVSEMYTSDEEDSDAEEIDEEDINAEDSDEEESIEEESGGEGSEEKESEEDEAGNEGDSDEEECEIDDDEVTNDEATSSENHTDNLEE